jgi:hypothetical protein
MIFRCLVSLYRARIRSRGEMRPELVAGTRRHEMTRLTDAARAGLGAKLAEAFGL